MALSAELFQEGLSEPRNQIRRQRGKLWVRSIRGRTNHSTKALSGEEERGLCIWTQWHKMRSEVGEEHTWG